MYTRNQKKRTRNEEHERHEYKKLNNIFSKTTENFIRYQEKEKGKFQKKTTGGMKKMVSLKNELPEK